MKGLGKRVLIAAALLAAVGVTSAPAQQTMRVRGTIEKVDGNKIVVKSDKGAEITLTLTANAKIVGVAKARLADIKSGDFVGSAAMPQADGSQKALEVHIFAESMRGTGEGHRPYTTPGSTMTNGTVGDMVTATSGNTLTVKYKDGEKKIIVTPSVPIVRYEVSTKSAIKPGAAFTVTAATKKPDGSYDIGRINVGRDGVVPN
jgi:outer membrane lipoprotein SlyB